MGGDRTGKNIVYYPRFCGATMDFINNKQSGQLFIFIGKPSSVPYWNKNFPTKDDDCQMSSQLRAKLILTKWRPLQDVAPWDFPRTTVCPRKSCQGAARIAISHG